MKTETHVRNLLNTMSLWDCANRQYKDAQNELDSLALAWVQETMMTEGNDRITYDFDEEQFTYDSYKSKTLRELFILLHS